MKVPLSWLKDFVDITLPLPELVHRLTMAGLEVEDVQIIGLPMPKMESVPHAGSQTPEVSVSGLEWDPAKIVVASVSEVMPHPNADRLVLCKLFDGQQDHIVLTGAPNLFDYKGIGPLPKPLKVAYAKEGAKIYDGHQPGQALTTLKRAKIRGVDSYSMICSEKELGISDDHEGVILLDEEAPVGAPLADTMGDAVLNIAILPNIARDVNMYGVAREIAALTGQPLRKPQYPVVSPPSGDFARIEITDPELNPRFVLGLIRNVTIAPSPYWLQRRLKLAGMRPINNIVDATNYVMLELGEPLHAFDYDVLMQRAGGGIPTIITRTAHPNERLTTLDGVDHSLEPFTELVCDTAGALSIAGVMGGAESEVTANTRHVLLEGAAWNFINIRKTVASQKLNSEASYRFSRGVHPAMAERGVRRCLDLMAVLTGGQIDPALVDNYPLPPLDPVVAITSDDVTRWLGITLRAEEIVKILQALEFQCTLVDSTNEIVGSDSAVVIHARTPDHRLDIGAGLTGKADLMEEIARIYGYDRIPDTRLADALPPQRNAPLWEREDHLRDVLAGLGLQEVINYRLTTPAREARRLPVNAAPDDKPYVRLANPIASDRDVLRHSLLASVVETIERNAHIRPLLTLFEIGPIFLGSESSDLPDELLRLVIVLTGPRTLPGWQPADQTPMDFFDLKGNLTALFDGLSLADIHWEPATHPSFHPGRCARIRIGDQQIGVMGELHPQVCERYDLPPTPLLAADLDLDTLLPLIPERCAVEDVPSFPPVLEDLALVVDEALPADQVEALIRQAGGKIVSGVRLFDVYRSQAIGANKKSLAYSIAYQAPNKTLTDKDVAGIRTRIVRRLEQELGAKLRS